MARKPKYNQEVHDKIIELIEKGYIDKEVCKVIGVSTAAYYEWLKEDSDTYKPLLVEAIKEAKKIIDLKVEQKLFKRTMGYKYDEITKELVKDIEGNQKLEITKIVTKEVAPDIAAQIFWLKNRQPERWRDTKIIHNVNNDKSMIEGLLGESEET